MPEFSWSELDIIYNDEDMYECMCASAQASDFYFHIANVDGMTSVVITPKDYFNSKGYMWDQHLPIEHLLPDDLGEDMECAWSSRRDVESVRKDLLECGFEQNAEFDAFINMEDLVDDDGEENFDGA
jgi:hypothetical protein